MRVVILGMITIKDIVQTDEVAPPLMRDFGLES